MTKKGNYIAGTCVGGPDVLDAGAGGYSSGTVALVDKAAAAAQKAFASFSATNREVRADFLQVIADKIEVIGPDLTQVAMVETGLPELRLEGERGRTTAQIRMFAEHIRSGKHLDLRHDTALPERTPLPRPDLKLIQRPIGPVAVFGASNFPLAFSVAGGDTASALAAGCPVVVKGHPAHPGTSALVAAAITAAVAEMGLDAGVFSMVQDGGVAVGQALVEHPAITAVGFTGSLRGGKALFDLCAARPKPIPFFGELGAVNPVFVLPHALADRGAQIGSAWAASLTMGAGQFCTNPGVVVLVEGRGADGFVDAAKSALAEVSAQTMLTDGIASAFQSGADRIAANQNVIGHVARPNNGRQSQAYMFEVDGKTWMETPELAHEVFGPLGIVIRAKTPAELRQIAEGFDGQLTATLQIDASDYPLAAQLMPTLEAMAGRVLANGFPTGVEVADAMVHGGPYPASTNFGATSVGSMAIRRWLRPVSYQNIPEDLLPLDLR